MKGTVQGLLFGMLLLWLTVFIAIFIGTADPATIIKCDSMSRFRYALGGGVACWLLEPVERAEELQRQGREESDK